MKKSEREIYHYSLCNEVSVYRTNGLSYSTTQKLCIQSKCIPHFGEYLKEYTYTVFKVLQYISMIDCNYKSYHHGMFTLLDQNVPIEILVDREYDTL